MTASYLLSEPGPRWDSHDARRQRCSAVLKPAEFRSAWESIVSVISSSVKSTFWKVGPISGCHITFHLLSIHFQSPGCKCFDVFAWELSEMIDWNPENLGWGHIKPECDPEIQSQVHRKQTLMTRLNLSHRGLLKAVTLKLRLASKHIPDHAGSKV